MKPTTTSSKDHRHINTQRVKNMLFQGKKLTKPGLDQLLHVSNSGEIIRRLRHEHGIQIDTVETKKGGKIYYHYEWAGQKKQSRIESRAYVKH